MRQHQAARPLCTAHHPSLASAGRTHTPPRLCHAPQPPRASSRCSARCRSADATAALRLALTGGAQLAVLGPADLAELAAALEAAISLGGAVDASATLELATATSAGSEPGGMTTAELRVRLAAAPGSLGSHDDLVAVAQGSDSWLPTLATLLPAAWFPAGEPCQRAGQGGGCARGSRGPTTLGRDPPPPPHPPSTHPHTHALEHTPAHALVHTPLPTPSAACAQAE